MKIIITKTYNVENCENCPDSYTYRDMGMSCLRCGNQKWEATISKTNIPFDCPYLPENKNLTTEQIREKVAEKSEEEREAILSPFKVGFSIIGAELIEIKEDGMLNVEFIVSGGNPDQIAEVLYKNLPVMYGTKGNESGMYEGMTYRFSRPEVQK